MPGLPCKLAKGHLCLERVGDPTWSRHRGTEAGVPATALGRGGPCGVLTGEPSYDGQAVDLLTNGNKGGNDIQQKEGKGGRGDAPRP